MQKKKIIIVVLAVVVVVAIALYFILSSHPQDEEKTIKIGVVYFRTGSAAKYGEWVKNGLELAKDELNAKGGINGRRIELIYEDDASQPTQAVSAAQKLISVDKAQVIIGGVTSSSFLAMAPLADRNKIVMISPCSSSPAITGSGDFVFRNWPSDTYEAKVMAQFAFNDLQENKCYVLAMNNEYGLGLKDEFSSNYTALGGQIVGTDTYDQDATDFRTQLQKIASSNTECIYVPGHGREVGRIIRQAREMGITAQILGSVTFESPELLQIAGTAAEGAFYTAPSYDPTSDNPVVAAFSEAYSKKYGQLPEVFAAHSYDALMILAKAIANGGTSSEGIKKALYEIKDYPGVTGSTTFDSNGDVSKPAFIKTVKNSHFAIYKGN